MVLGGAFKMLIDTFLKNTSSILSVTGNAILTGILYGAQRLMEEHSRCPCDPELNGRYSLIAFCVPGSVLFLISLLVLPDARKVVTCRVRFDSPHTCRCENFQSCSESRFSTEMRKFYFCLYTLLKISVPSVLWVVILLADGDYYACAYILPSNATVDSQICALSCASSPEEILPRLRSLCFRSRMFGGIVLVSTLMFLVILQFLPEFICPDEREAKSEEETEMEDIQTGEQR
ncbi:uncharacterized protein [Hemitrygon akajei]|uniref:uncharacterized protein n=1 Tax=Hemitrygon akajei TaxID=2704970 RepID=UPI003BF9AA5F